MKTCEPPIIQDSPVLVTKKSAHLHIFSIYLHSKVGLTLVNRFKIFGRLKSTLRTVVHKSYCRVETRPISYRLYIPIWGICDEFIPRSLRDCSASSFFFVTVFSVSTQSIFPSLSQS